jgi:hypothetical protein
MGALFDGTYGPAADGGKSVPVQGAGRFEVGDVGVMVSAQAKFPIGSWFVGAFGLGAFAAAILYSDDGPPYPSWPKAAVMAAMSVLWLAIAVKTLAQGALKPATLTVPWANVGAIGPAAVGGKAGVRLTLSGYKPSPKPHFEVAPDGAIFFAPNGDPEAVVRAVASARPGPATG